MDSETLNPQLTAELRSLNLVALTSPLTSGGQFPAMRESAAAQVKVFTFVSEIEAVFFEAPDVLDRLIGKKPPQEKVKEGHFVPKQVLAELLANGMTHRDYKEALEHLDPTARQALATGSQASSLKATVELLLTEAA